MTKYGRNTIWPQYIDYDVQPKDWLHPADTIRVTEHQEESAIQIFTDGSKSELGVVAGVALFVHNKLMHQKTFTLHNNCSNNQAEQWVIVKALETITELQTAEDVPREVTIHTDSRITLQSLRNSKNHKYLIDQIRKKATSLKKHN
jgi:ribonuclease HI